MLHRLRAVRKNDKGFTLTELLIVIVILGVLTGIVVFAVGAFSDRGVKAACSADKRIVQTAVEAFYAKNGTYPDDVAALGTATNNFLRPPLPPTTVADGAAKGYYVSYVKSTGAVTANLVAGGVAGAAC